MDNSPAWDDALGAVPEVDWAYQRRDLGHVDADQRPHKPEYDRYLFLVDFYKRHGFDSQYIYEHCPYKVIDIGIVSILQRAGNDLLELCRIVGHDEGVAELKNELARTQTAVNRLWSRKRHCFLNHDLIAGLPIDEVTTATVLPLFAGLASAEQAAAMVNLVDDWLDATKVGLSSTHPSSPRYEAQRYWRGPVWLHINWMIALGAEDYGYRELARRLQNSARDCVTSSGFWEYFDADTGDGCGGDNFTWTAAVALYWLAS
jgi:glycogen debranching enzyme